jgi:RNA polymerase sigma-70 factor (ECF subfamily)
MRNETPSERIEAADLAESLVHRIGAGDQSAEGQLVTHYRRGLYLILRKECGDADLAEDLTQDTLEKVIMNAREGKIQKPGALAGYIRQLGIYQLIDFRRKEVRRKTKPTADIAKYNAADNTSLIDAVDTSQAGELIRQLLAEMTVPRDREILRRFYLIGQDKAVIADELSVTPAHFDRVKSRALLRLRKLVLGHLKSHGAERADLLSLLLISALVSGSLAGPAIPDRTHSADHGEGREVPAAVREYVVPSHYTCRASDVVGLMPMST